MLHVLDTEAGAAPEIRPGHDRAIVTLCIGDHHRGLWERVSRANWLAYAARHGYDVIQIVAPLDQSTAARARSPAWQKCLVPDQPWARQYRRIVWLDADIIISAHARDIVASQPDPARIGACISGEQLSRADLHVYLERFHHVSIDPAQLDLLWGMHIGNQFTHGGITPGQAPMLNTGVLVLAPDHHAPLLRAVYDRGDADNGLYEQPALSLAIGQAGLRAPLSARFNWSMHEAMMLRYAVNPRPPFTARQTQALLSFVADEIERAYFVHFCGCMPLLTLFAGMRPALAVPA